MTHLDAIYATLDEWIASESIPCSPDALESFNAAVDQVIASLDNSVELLGFGEALHGGEDILLFRNRLFQRLVEAHGYSAIAIESSFPNGRIVNEYVLGRGLASYDAVQDTGFTHNFGKLDTNRELVEWMRSYNADASHPVKLHFYGFDSPTEITGADSPRHVLHFTLAYFTSFDKAGGQEYRSRIDPLLGQDDAWENFEAMLDPAKSIGLSPQANALRLATEELISELCLRRPELVAKSGQSRYLEALQYAVEARQLLNYHAEIARQSEQRMSRLLGLRDTIMADNLAYIVSQERERGKVLAFAHNSHLQRRETVLKGEWQGEAYSWTWWPVGAHLNAMFGERYTIIGSAVGTSPTNGIGQPEPGTLETRLLSQPGSVRFIPTHQGQGLAVSELPTRSGSTKNPSYAPLTPQSFTNFDWLAVFASTAFSRGVSWLENADANTEQ